MTSRNDLTINLTDPQHRAVTHMEGPMLVLAGPGSGKTRVIIHRIAHLINHSVNPGNILAITFTNKAAQEMRNRLAVIGVPRGSTICTFHSLGARLLREFWDLAQIPPNFSIYDTADQITAMRLALKICEYDTQNFPPARILNRISKYKNDLQTPDQIVPKSEYDFLAKKMVRIYQAYQDQLTHNGALDFDDLLMKLAFLLRDNQQLRDQLNDRYRFVLVDEYQDTNHCQYQIARGLALNHNNLFVTGDPDQSIYAWRGADIGNILAFEEDNPNAQTVSLEENFRSTPQILDLADNLIRVNEKRREKKLFTSIPPGDPPQLYEYHNEYEEARGLARTIKQLNQQNIEYRQIAVFYRVNSMSRVLEEALRRENIPYQIVRGLEFFKRREIKDMIAYLRLLINHADEIALRRIINRPARGIGETTVGRLFQHSDATGKDIWHILNTVEHVPTLNTAAKAKVKKFVDMIIDLQSQLDGPVKTIMQQVYEKTGLKETLAGDKSENPANNVNELINSAAQYDSEAENKPNLIEYLQEIALLSDADGYDEESGAVSLMTLHAAKGLEFPAVFIVGLEDGLIPHSRSLNDSSDTEEERRLLFVGITRAQRILYLSSARNRTVQGSALSTIRSEFLRDLPNLEHHVVQTPDAYMEQNDSQDDFANYPDPYYDDEDSNGLRVGQLVRHPSLGIGKIEKVSPQGQDSKVVIQFKSGSRRTIHLQYCELEKLDYCE